MLKRVMAMVLSVCMIAALFTAVSAEETVVGGNQLTKSLTDECADLSKVWSVKNIETADENKAPLNIDLYGDKTALWLTEPGKAAEIVYRAADEKSFSSIYLEVSSCAEIKWPSIEYSTNGTAYQTLVKESDRNWDAPSTLGWTRLFNSDKNNGWQKAFKITADVPEGTKYVRISASADEKRGNNDNLMFRKVTLGVRGLISENLTDDFTTFDNVYSMTNFELKNAINQGGAITNAELSGNTAEPKDINTLIMSKHTEKAELVYRAADNKQFVSFGMSFWRQDNVKFPEIAYSKNGQEWTTLIEATDSAVFGNDTYWPLTQSPNGTNNWIAVHENKLKDISGAKFVKITFPAGTVGYDNKRVNARIVNTSFTVANLISENFTDDFTDLDKAYAMTNFEKATAINQGGVITNAELSGNTAEPKTINTLIMSKHTEKAEIVYRAADSKQFTSIDMNFWRQDNVKFPEIAYSEDGQEWTTLIQATDSAVSGNSANWSLTQSPNGTNNWIAVHNNIQKNVSGAKLIKVTFPASTVAYDNKRVNARIIDLTLTVDDVAYANTLSVAADGTATLTDAGGKANGAKLFIAEYNSDDILINAAAYSVALINGSFEKKLEKTADGAYFKAFLFGGESGTEPITAFATSKN